VTLVLLHGFLGLPEGWSEVAQALTSRERVLRPALMGHGAADWDPGALPDTFEDEVDRLASRLDAEHVAAAHLVGYSMGARVALVLAVRHPRLVSRLTLVSGTAGLDDDEERRARAVADDRLAAALREEGLPTFVRKWEALPLFATQQRLSAGARARHRARRLAHRETFVARALEVLSPGRMPVMTEHLGQVDVPVTLVTGALDPKFTAIARSIAPLFPSARVRVVDGAGHDPCLERPRELASILSAPSWPDTVDTEIAP
jgi:2-succinyl-6-hydroxy-2,4-cyclohexadiene-1-carboxylate synthase